MKKSFADILSDMDTAQNRKLASKLPSWAAAKCSAPSRLALEQCSSETAARYKAGLVAAGGEAPALTDITGGMGVDSWAFSQVCSKVLYNERESSLFNATRRNFERLGVSNVEFSCRDSESKDFTEQIRLFKPDWIFADPARRAADGSGRKVFRLEDCTPNILALLPTLLGNARHVMLKLSPMADIRMVTSQLSGIKEVHVVGVDGEVKEILCILERGRSGRWPVKAVSLKSSPEGEYRADVTEFTLNDETASQMKTAPEPVPGQILFEPSSILLKAGCFKLLCERFKMLKLERSTHLYILPEGFSSHVPDGKTFRIVGVSPLSKASLKEFGARYPDSDVTARNIPMTSEELRSHLHVKGGGAHHIWGVCTAASGNLLIATEPLLGE